MTALEIRFEKALNSREPMEELRVLVGELSAEGTDKAEIFQIFETQRQRLRAANRESDEDAVMDVMDFLVGWCSPHVQLLPDAPVASNQNRLPIYLEPDVAEFIRSHAREKNVKTDTLVNQWLRNNIAALA